MEFDAIAYELKCKSHTLI